MILYHGSNIKINLIDLSKSKPGKDFGKGFYLSDTEQQALEFAQYKAEQFGGEPIVTKFSFDELILKNPKFKTKHFKGYTLDWLDFVISNRMGLQSEVYDFVYGPIADDRVGRQLRRFFDKDIDKEELMERLKYTKGITYQYYFGTEESIRLLHLIEE